MMDINGLKLGGNDPSKKMTASSPPPPHTHTLTLTPPPPNTPNGHLNHPTISVEEKSSSTYVVLQLVTRGPVEGSDRIDDATLGVDGEAGLVGYRARGTRLQVKVELVVWRLKI